MVMISPPRAGRTVPRDRADYNKAAANRGGRDAPGERGAAP